MKRKAITPVERFWCSVRKDSESGCWLWIGYRNNHGYGMLYVDGRRMLAHRFAFMGIANREIPDGQELDHLCRNPGCVNPVHLEAVSHKENLTRGAHAGSPAINANKVVCIKGHPLSGDNLRIVKEGDRTRRRCVTCYRETIRFAQRRLRARIANGQ